MKKLLLLTLPLLFLSSCATSYQHAARSNYIGNGQHEIRANGNGYTKGDSIRQFLYRKAFETCEVEGKGFKIVKQDDTSETRTVGYSQAFGVVTADQAHFPGARMLIECEGPIDQRLAAEINQLRNPASK